MCKKDNSQLAARRVALTCNLGRTQLGTQTPRKNNYCVINKANFIYRSNKQESMLLSFSCGGAQTCYLIVTTAG